MSIVCVVTSDAHEQMILPREVKSFFLTRSWPVIFLAITM